MLMQSGDKGYFPRTSIWLDAYSFNCLIKSALEIPFGTVACPSTLRVIPLGIAVLLVVAVNLTFIFFFLFSFIYIIIIALLDAFVKGF
jgi:hypothetical protein